MKDSFGKTEDHHPHPQRPGALSFIDGIAGALAQACSVAPLSFGGGT
ncbi:hypothetical protein [Iodidimonas nitroreducens]|nr:hypothetical protein [Iodidimonas nitroreducens]